MPDETAAAGARFRSREFGLGVGQCRLGQDACAVAARHPPAARRHRPVEDTVPDLYARRRRQHVEPRLLQPVGLDHAWRRGAGGEDRGDRRPAARAPTSCADARKLFAEALETPGGLKIQTIHAFCESVLHQFPLEANIAGAFRDARPADGGRAVRRGAPRNADRRGRRQTPGSPRLSPWCWSAAASSGWTCCCRRSCASATGCAASSTGLAATPAAYATLFEEFGFAPGETAETIAECGLAAAGLSADVFETFRRAANLAMRAERPEQHRCPCGHWPLPRADPVRRLKLLARAFSRPTASPTIRQGLQEGAAATRCPICPSATPRPSPRSSRRRDRLALFRMLEGTRAALTIADWLIARYEQLKSGPRLPRLQRPDHPHGPAAGAPGCRRLGAIQARPGHRPHSARRGAGHQPGPVERGQAAGGRVLRRLWRARQCPPHGVCRRRREAVDLFLPGRVAGILRRDRRRVLARASATPMPASSRCG